MEEVYKENGNLSFGDAIEFGLKRGKRVQRRGWNGKGLFVFMQVPSEIPIEIVPKMTSLPQSVKDEFKRRHLNCKSDWDIDCIFFNSITYDKQLALVHPNNSITGWSPSTTDALTNDWVILD